MMSILFNIPFLIVKVIKLQKATWSWTYLFIRIISLRLSLYNHIDNLHLIRHESFQESGLDDSIFDVLRESKRCVPSTKDHACHATPTAAQDSRGYRFGPFFGWLVGFKALWHYGLMARLKKKVSDSCVPSSSFLFDKIQWATVFLIAHFIQSIAPL